jgi:histidine triad (HIT) family protein
VTDQSSLEMPNDGRCAFCDYLSRRRPFTIWVEDDLVAILVTREQRGASHLLVMPVRHCESILDLTDAESGELMDAIRRSARAIDLAEHRPGIAIWQNNGVPAHQSIPHLHFHVAGTLPEGGTNWGSVRELSISETDEIALRLTAAEGEGPPSALGQTASDGGPS